MQQSNGSLSFETYILRQKIFTSVETPIFSKKKERYAHISFYYDDLTKISNKMTLIVQITFSLNWTTQTFTRIVNKTIDLWTETITKWIKTQKHIIMKISDNLLKTTFKRPSLPQHFGKLIFGRNLLHGIDPEGKLILFICIYCILKTNRFTIKYLIAI